MAFQSRSLKDYNDGSTWQLDIDLQTVPNIIAYLKEAEGLTPSTIQIADFGCSEGYNAMKFYQKVIKKFRETSSRPINILHTDLPDNNWSCVFHTINGSDNSYQKFENVFYSALGKSFYRPLAPAGSIHVATANFSFQYLSKVPLRTQSEVDLLYPEAAEQAMADLMNNLSLRVKELAVGGMISIIVPGRDAESNVKLTELYFQPVKNLMAKGIIRQEEYQNYYWPTYHLHINQWREVLKAFEGSLEAIELKVHKSVCPFYIEYSNGGSPEEYKRKLLGYMSVLVRNPLNSCLMDRNQEEKELIYKACIEEILNVIDFSEVCMYWTHAVLRKIREI